MKNFIIKLLAFVPALTLTLAPATVLAAGTARFSLSPASGTYLLDSTLATTVSFTTNNEPVNVVTVKLDYDHLKLQLIGVDTTGSVFDQGFVKGDNITRYSTGGTVTGGKIATVSFKVMGSSGTVTVGFAAGSQIARSNPPALSTDIWDQSNTLGGTYAMAAPAVRAATTTAPKKTVATTTTAETSNETTTTPAPVTTAEPKEVKTETTIGDDDGSKDEEGKTTSSNTWLRLVLLGIAAAGFGYVAARRYKDTDKTASADKAVTPAVVAKPSSKKAKVTPKGKTAKKATPKKTKKAVKKTKK